MSSPPHSNFLRPSLKVIGFIHCLYLFPTGRLVGPKSGHKCSIECSASFILTAEFEVPPGFDYSLDSHGVIGCFSF